MIENCERLTWEEIVAKYPDRWLGLTEIIWEDDTNIESAIVKYSDKTRNELLKIQFSGTEDLYCRYTTPDNIFQIGVLG